MLQHVVLLRFVPSCTAADLYNISQRFSRLALLVPGILSLNGGADYSMDLPMAGCCSLPTWQPVMPT